MKNPHAAAWSRILDIQERFNQPVYVEIDPETEFITRVLVPELTGVMSIEPRPDNDDVDVVFFKSQARHYLNRLNDDFQSMLDMLNEALSNETEVLVTADRHDFEIINVQPPPKGAGAEPAGPIPPPLPDPPVSPTRAQQLFDMMNARSCDACSANCAAYPHCIPFKHANDGCYARAHEMCRLMMAEGEDPEKVWIYGGLHVSTSNVHECEITWGWHVAPTLMVTPTSGPDEKYVIDPSLCTTPVTVADWKALQDDPGANLLYTSWEPFWSDHATTDSDFSLTNHYLELKCTYLQDDCVTYGAPPYDCPIARSCHFIVDRSMYSESEVEAMLAIANPAEVAAAFYVVVDGYAPDSLGISSSSLSGVPDVTPTLAISPGIAQMSAEAVALDVEDPTHLQRRQRITWTYKVAFTGTGGFGFSGDIETVTLTASIASVSNTAAIYLLKQPNPYEIDGETSWLSTDLRVFQIKQGESKFGVNMVSDPSGFITGVIDNLNTGNTGGQTFESDISVNQQTSRLEISETVNSTPVYNFAVAKVRYRSLMQPATDVRVFFRLFPWATSSVEYDQATSYRRHESGSDIIALPGVSGGRLTSIPCFASPRVDSSTTSLTLQTDSPNVVTIPALASGNEMVRYFGCWLDINQSGQLQFPVFPSPVDGPYPSDRVAIQDHIRSEHQCLVSEIAFNPAPIANGSRPSTSDKLAQRNLAIVESANPGLLSSRRIPQTFEIRPSRSKVEHDELMIDWGNLPPASVATFYLPGFDSYEIIRLATKKYHSQHLVRIDGHTIKCEAGGITYLPIPFSDGSFPGLLTIDLPEGVEKGQVFKVVVRQVTGEQQTVPMTHVRETHRRNWRHIVGSFQLTIPVREKAEMLTAQQRLLSNLRWIKRAIPANDVWSAVFNRYVSQIATRVDALGGDSGKVAPSPTGQWKEAHRSCLIQTLVIVLLIILLMLDLGLLSGGLMGVSSAAIAALIVAVMRHRQNRCRPGVCRLLKTLLAGTGIGTIILALVALFGGVTPQLVATLITGAGVTAAIALAEWLKGCFK